VNSHLHPAPRLRTSGAITLLPMYTFMAWEGITSPSPPLQNSSHTFRRTTWYIRTDDLQKHAVCYQCSVLMFHTNLYTPTNRLLDMFRCFQRTTYLHHQAKVTRRPYPIRFSTKDARSMSVRIVAKPVHFHKVPNSQKKIAIT
jgi:hypothetical protein